MSGPRPTNFVQDDLTVENVRSRIHAKLAALPKVDAQGRVIARPPSVAPADLAAIEAELGAVSSARASGRLSEGDAQARLEVLGAQLAAHRAAHPTDGTASTPTLLANPAQGGSAGGAVTPPAPRTVLESIAAKTRQLPKTDHNGRPIQ